MLIVCALARIWQKWPFISDTFLLKLIIPVSIKGKKWTAPAWGTFYKMSDQYSSKLSRFSKTKSEKLPQPRGVYRDMRWGEVAQSFLTLCDPVDCSLPGSSVHGILQARILEWVAIYFSRDIPSKYNIVSWCDTGLEKGYLVITKEIWINYGL